MCGEVTGALGQLGLQLLDGEGEGIVVTGTLCPSSFCLDVRYSGGPGSADHAGPMILQQPRCQWDPVSSQPHPGVSS